MKRDTSFHESFAHLNDNHSAISDKFKVMLKSDQRCARRQETSNQYDRRELDRIERVSLQEFFLLHYTYRSPPKQVNNTIVIDRSNECAAAKPSHYCNLRERNAELKILRENRARQERSRMALDECRKELENQRARLEAQRKANFKEECSRRIREIRQKKRSRAESSDSRNRDESRDNGITERPGTERDDQESLERGRGRDGGDRDSAKERPGTEEYYAREHTDRGRSPGDEDDHEDGEWANDGDIGSEKSQERHRKHYRDWEGRGQPEAKSDHGGLGKSGAVKDERSQESSRSRPGRREGRPSYKDGKGYEPKEEVQKGYGKYPVGDQGRPSGKKRWESDSRGHGGEASRSADEPESRIRRGSKERTGRGMYGKSHRDLRKRGSSADGTAERRQGTQQEESKTYFKSKKGRDNYFYGKSKESDEDEKPKAGINDRSSKKTGKRSSQEPGSNKDQRGPRSSKSSSEALSVKKGGTGIDQSRRGHRIDSDHRGLGRDRRASDERGIGSSRSGSDHKGVEKGGADGRGIGSVRSGSDHRGFEKSAAGKDGSGIGSSRSGSDYRDFKKGKADGFGTSRSGSDHRGMGKDRTKPDSRDIGSSRSGSYHKGFEKGGAGRDGRGIGSSRSGSDKKDFEKAGVRADERGVRSSKSGSDHRDVKKGEARKEGKSIGSSRSDSGSEKGDPGVRRFGRVEKNDQHLKSYTDKKSGSKSELERGGGGFGKSGSGADKPSSGKRFGSGSNERRFGKEGSDKESNEDKRQGKSGTVSLGPYGKSPGKSKEEKRYFKSKFGIDDFIFGTRKEDKEDDLSYWKPRAGIDKRSYKSPGSSKKIRNKTSGSGDSETPNSFGWFGFGKRKGNSGKPGSEAGLGKSSTGDSKSESDQKFRDKSKPGGPKNSGTSSEDSKWERSNRDKSRHGPSGQHHGVSDKSTETVESNSGEGGPKGSQSELNQRSRNRSNYGSARHRRGESGGNPDENAPDSGQLSLAEKDRKSRDALKSRQHGHEPEPHGKSGKGSKDERGGSRYPESGHSRDDSEGSRASDDGTDEKRRGVLRDKSSRGFHNGLDGHGARDYKSSVSEAQKSKDDAGDHSGDGIDRNQGGKAGKKGRNGDEGHQSEKGSVEGRNGKHGRKYAGESPNDSARVHTDRIEGGKDYSNAGEDERSKSGSKQDHGRGNEDGRNGRGANQRPRAGTGSHDHTDHDRIDQKSSQKRPRKDDDVESADNENEQGGLDTDTTKRPFGKGGLKKPGLYGQKERTKDPNENRVIKNDSKKPGEGTQEPGSDSTLSEAPHKDGKKSAAGDHHKRHTRDDHSDYEKPFEGLDPRRLRPKMQPKKPNEHGEPTMPEEEDEEIVKDHDDHGKHPSDPKHHSHHERKKTRDEHSDYEKRFEGAGPRSLRPKMPGKKRSKVQPGETPDEEPEEEGEEEGEEEDAAIQGKEEQKKIDKEKKQPSFDFKQTVLNQLEKIGENNRKYKYPKMVRFYTPPKAFPIRINPRTWRRVLKYKTSPPEKDENQDPHKVNQQRFGFSIEESIVPPVLAFIEKRKKAKKLLQINPSVPLVGRERNFRKRKADPLSSESRYSPLKYWLLLTNSVVNRSKSKPKEVMKRNASSTFLANNLNDLLKEEHQGREKGSFGVNFSKATSVRHPRAVLGIHATDDTPREEPMEWEPIKTFYPREDSYFPNKHFDSHEARSYKQQRRYSVSSEPLGKLGVTLGSSHRTNFKYFQEEFAGRKKLVIKRRHDGRAGTDGWAMCSRGKLTKPYRANDEASDIDFRPFSLSLFEDLETNKEKKLAMSESQDTVELSNLSKRRISPESSWLHNQRHTLIKMRNGKAKPVFKKDPPPLIPYLFSYSPPTHGTAKLLRRELDTKVNKKDTNKYHSSQRYCHRHKNTNCGATIEELPSSSVNSKCLAVTNALSLSPKIKFRQVRTKVSTFSKSMVKPAVDCFHKWIENSNAIHNEEEKDGDGNTRLTRWPLKDFSSSKTNLSTVRPFPSQKIQFRTQLKAQQGFSIVKDKQSHPICQTVSCHDLSRPLNTPFSDISSAVDADIYNKTCQVSRYLGLLKSPIIEFPQALLQPKIGKTPNNFNLIPGSEVTSSKRKRKASNPATAHKYVRRDRTEVTNAPEKSMQSDNKSVSNVSTYEATDRNQILITMEKSEHVRRVICQSSVSASYESSTKCNDNETFSLHSKPHCHTVCKCSNNHQTKKKAFPWKEKKSLQSRLDEALSEAIRNRYKHASSYDKIDISTMDQALSESIKSRRCKAKRKLTWYDSMRRPSPKQPTRNIDKKPRALWNPKSREKTVLRKVRNSKNKNTVIYPCFRKWIKVESLRNAVSIT